MVGSAEETFRIRKRMTLPASAYNSPLGYSEAKKQTRQKSRLLEDQI